MKDITYHIFTQNKNLRLNIAKLGYIFVVGGHILL